MRIGLLFPDHISAGAPIELHDLDLFTDMAKSMGHDAEAGERAIATAMAKSSQRTFEVKQTTS